LQQKNQVLNFKMAGDDKKRVERRRFAWRTFTRRTTIRAAFPVVFQLLWPYNPQTGPF